VSSEGGAAAAAIADSGDPLAPLRDRFTLPGGTIYLDGNSLGAMPRAVVPALGDALDRQWSTDLITSWNDNGWWELPTVVGDRIAGLIGAGPGQVMCGDSTSIQLFQALVAGARLRPGRSTVITDAANFPTDQYIADSVARLLGLQLVRVDPSELAEHLDANTAIVSLSMVDYRTGELFDVTSITAAVRNCGAIMLWDLCHCAGALPVNLDALGAELAVGCTYKYLNGGPGSPAFIYLSRSIQAEVDLPLTGWHGHARPFDLEPSFRPAADVQRARIGTPPLLSMLSLQAALTAFDDVSIDEIRRKSLGLTDLVIAYADQRLTGFDVEVVTPREHDRRGSQVCLRMPYAYEVCQALIGRGVIGDFRAPDLLRLGLAPLYLRYGEVHDAMTVLEDVLASKAYLDPSLSLRSAVT